MQMQTQNLTKDLNSKAQQIQISHSQQEPSEGLQGITVLIIFLLIVVISIYLISLLLVLIRKVRKILKGNARFYYAIVLFYIITKMILCTILIIEIISEIPNSWSQLNGENIEIIFKNSIQLADLSTIVLFLVAMYFYLKICFFAIGRHQNWKHKMVLLNGIKISLVLAVLAFIIPLIIYDFKEIQYQALNLISGIFNAIVVLTFLISFFYFNFKMTGIMVEQKLSDTIKRIYKMLCIILISRTVMLTLQIIIIVKIQNGSFQSFIEIIEQIHGQIVVFGLSFVVVIVCMLLTEGLPFMYCLRSSVVDAFMACNSLKQDSQHLNHESIITSNTSVIKQGLLKPDDFEYDEPELEEAEELSLKKFHNLIDLADSQSSIWIVKRGKLAGEQFIIKIAKHQISSYILEDIETEINKLSSLKLKYLNPIAFFMEKQIVCIVQKYFPFNLDNLVDNLQSPKQICSLALEVAKGILELHDNNLVHGCLRPSYILFDKNKELHITGFGLQSFKKYLSLITGYSNKNIYSSVQLLSDRNNIIIKPKKEDDVYSFGILMYQMVTKNKLYRDQTLKDIHTKFCDENFRPKIPENMNTSIKSLIRKCWQQDWTKRPTIKQIVATLRKIIDQY